jgi:hypothetical protein
MFGAQLSRVAEEPAAAADGVADPTGGASSFLCVPIPSKSISMH